MSGVRSPQGDPVAPLTRLLERTLTVADIVSTPLWTVKPDMVASDVIAAMSVHGFDVGGVGPEPVLRYVDRLDLRDLDGPVEQVSKPIPASHCIEKSLPVASLFQLLAASERLFVLDGDRVRWVVTRADLAAPAVSVAVLSYLTIIESGLQQLAQGCTDEDVLAKLSPDRRRSVEELYAKKCLANAEISRRSCLYFSDWLTVIKKSPDLIGALGYETLRRFDSETKSFADVRNDLAHGRDLLSSADPIRALKRVDRIRAFSSAVWEALRERDSIWDVYAQTIVVVPGRREKVLTGPSAGRSWSFPSRCHVVTAWNPGSVWMSEARNVEANRKLREAIVRRGGKAVDVVGRSPNRSWSEPSFLVTGLTRSQVCDLAAVFGQLAIFELSAERLHVVDVSNGKTVKSVARRPG